jgi:hypothetical protein
VFHLYWILTTFIPISPDLSSLVTTTPECIFSSSSFYYFALKNTQEIKFQKWRLTSGEEIDKLSNRSNRRLYCIKTESVLLGNIYPTLRTVQNAPPWLSGWITLSPTQMEILLVTETLSRKYEIREADYFFRR